MVPTAPTISQPVVRVVLVAENFRARGVHFVCGAAVYVVLPAGNLALAVSQVRQRAAGIVSKTVRGNTRIDLVRLASQSVIRIIHHVRSKLIGVAGNARNVDRVNEFLLAAIRVTFGQWPVEVVIRARDCDAIGIDAVRSPVKDIIRGGKCATEGVANRNQQTLIVVIIGHAGEPADGIREPAQRIVVIGHTTAVRIKRRGDSPLVEANLKQQCQPDEEKNWERQFLALLTSALMGDPF